jgi:hypothetical protein
MQVNEFLRITYLTSSIRDLYSFRSASIASSREARQAAKADTQTATIIDISATKVKAEKSKAMHSIEHAADPLRSSLDFFVKMFANLFREIVVQATAMRTVVLAKS